MIKKKKLTILIIALCVVLAALVVAYILISKHAASPDDDKIGAPTNLIEGEGFLLNKITIYPEISNDKIISVDVTNKDGVVTNLVHKSGSSKLYLKNYNNISIQSSVYSYLNAVITNAVTAESDTNPPIRDLSDEQMKKYGLTEDSCEAKYILKYLDKDVEKELTVFIGTPTYSSQSTRYAALKGRNTVYTMLNTEVFVDLTTEKCIEPLICNIYKSEEATTSIKNFAIAYGSTPLVRLENITNDATATYGEAAFALVYPKKTLADSKYFSNVATTLFSNFTGDEVVCILNPNDVDKLKEYGFDDFGKVYQIGADHKSGESTKFFVSDLQKENPEEDGYYYVMSLAYQNVGIIVKVSEKTLSFLSRKEERTVFWAATNTPLSGFYKYISPNEEDEQSGIKQITIKTPIREETFYVTSEKRIIDGTERNYVVAITKSGKRFEDDYSVFNNEEYIKDNSYASRLNNFRNLYAYFVYYPMPYRFCSLNDEEILKCKSNENFMFELTVVTNDNKAEKYTYYANEFSSGYVIREEAVGTFDGEKCIFEESNIIFDTTRAHVKTVTDAIEKFFNLKDGEFLETDNEIW